MGEGCSLRDDFEDKNIQIEDSFYHPPTCFESNLFLAWDCTTSYHEIEHIEDVKTLQDRILQHMGANIFI